MSAGREKTKSSRSQGDSTASPWRVPLLAGAGFAVLYMVPFAASFLSASRSAVYHSLHPLTTIYRAMLVMLFGAWLLGVVAFRMQSRLPGAGRRIAGLILDVLLVLLLGRAIAAGLASAWGLDWTFRAANFMAIAALVTGLMLLWRRPALLDRIFAGTRVLYQVAAFGMLVLLPRLAFHALGHDAQETQFFERASLPAVAATEPRIVWVLMDELSYDQLFAHRDPSLAVPNFDVLARTSVVFSDLQPVGDHTEKVIPGLLLGKTLSGLEPNDRGQLAYRTGDGPWQSFDEHQTIFARAQAAGWTTGIAGWYNPYCRLMPDVLDRCFWQFSEPVSGNLGRYLSSTQPVSQNVLAMMPARHMLATLLHRPFSGGISPHRRDYLAVMAQAEALVQDPQIRFLFIHLNVPHPADIYDRVRHRMRDGGSYLDNVALADRSLGVLEQTIAATPAAASTTLVICSDHSWRTFLWRGSSAWSAEDERISSHGRFDPRPVLMVHLPGSRQNMTIAQPVSLMFVHTLLEAMLRGDIATDADVARLAQAASAARASQTPVAVMPRKE